MSAMSRTVIQTSGSARRGSGKALSGPVLQRLVPPPLDRRTDAHGFAIFGNGAAGDVEAFCPQQVHQRVVGQDFLRIFGCDQGLDMTLDGRSEEHTSELQSLMRISYAVFCLKKKKTQLSTHIQ